jgi:hypothetical protein
MVKLILPAYRRQGFLIEPNGPSYCKQAPAEMLDKKGPKDENRNGLKRTAGNGGPMS